ncbi:MAG: glycosyltransferase, partial [Phycisphaeraceae bacterium]|nr:glycosyltransferase [Phycisphaeraceae bacterium]
MRIGFFAHHVAAEGGSSAALLGRLAAELAEQGHSVSLYLEVWPGGMRFPPGVEIEPWPRPGRRMMVRRRRMAAAVWAGRRMAGARLDRAVSCSPLLAQPDMLLLAPPELMVVDQFRAGRGPLMGQRLLGLLERLNPEFADLLAMEDWALSASTIRRSMIVGELLARWWSSRRPDIAMTWMHAPLPVLADIAARSPDSALRRHLGLSRESAVYLLVTRNARLDPPAGVIRAFAGALAETRRADRAPATLLIHGQARYALQRLAESLGIRDRIKLLGTDTHLGSLLASVDAVLHPTWLDAWAGEARQAKLFGLPILVTPFSAAADMNNPERMPRHPHDLPRWQTAIASMSGDHATPEPGAAARAEPRDQPDETMDIDACARSLARWVIEDRP